MANHSSRFSVGIGILVAGLLLLLTIQFVITLREIDRQDDRKTAYPRVALLLEGPTYDQGWNFSALESLSRLKSEYGFDLKVADNLRPDEIVAVAESCAEQGYDLILGHGIIFSKPFTQVAPRHPHVRFVALNGEAVHPNQTAVRYDMKPAGYIVGQLAALMSKSGKVGYIVVDKPSEYAQVEGFREGAAAVNPSVLVTVKKVPDFNDVPGALKVAREMIASGVDVIYTTGDSFNLPVITEVQKAGIYAIGYIADQRYMAPNHVLASMEQDVGKVYSVLIERFLSDQLPSGNVTFGLAEGVNHLSPFGPMVPEQVKERIRRELQRITQQP